MRAYKAKTMSVEAKDSIRTGVSRRRSSSTLKAAHVVVYFVLFFGESEWIEGKNCGDGISRCLRHLALFFVQ